MQNRTDSENRSHYKYVSRAPTDADALLELNPQKLVQRVNEAETAILSRLQEIRIGSDSRLEAQAIEDALNGLRVLKNETVKFKQSQNAGTHYNTIGAESD